MQPKTKTKSTVKSGKVQSRIAQKPKKDLSFPLNKENFVIIAAGIVLIVIGYILMAENSVNGFLPTVVSPILLFLGYCVAIPYGILKKPKTITGSDGAAVTGEEEKIPAVKSNIKVG